MLPASLLPDPGFEEGRVAPELTLGDGLLSESVLPMRQSLPIDPSNQGRELDLQYLNQILLPIVCMPLIGL